MGVGEKEGRRISAGLPTAADRRRHRGQIYALAKPKTIAVHGSKQTKCGARNQTRLVCYKRAGASRCLRFFSIFSQTRKPRDSFKVAPSESMLFFGPSPFAPSLSLLRRRSRQPVYCGDGTARRRVRRWGVPRFYALLISSRLSSSPSKPPSSIPFHRIRERSWLRKGNQFLRCLCFGADAAGEHPPHPSACASAPLVWSSLQLAINKRLFRGRVSSESLIYLAPRNVCGAQT